MYHWSAKKKIWILATLGSMTLLLLYPFQTTVVPDWKVRIVDEAGNPISSFRVREVWQHYTIESTSHQEDLITDGEGYVTFPKRTVRGSLLVRIGRPMVNVLNVHASFGPKAYVSVLDDQTVPQLFSPGQPLTTQVVVKRVPRTAGY